MRQLYLAFLITVLIGGQNCNLTNAIKLRLMSNVDEGDLVALDDYSYS